MACSMLPFSVVTLTVIWGYTNKLSSYNAFYYPFFSIVWWRDPSIGKHVNLIQSPILKRKHKKIVFHINSMIC